MAVPSLGLATSVHAPPDACSISVRRIPAAVVWKPTAHALPSARVSTPVKSESQGKTRGRGQRPLRPVPVQRQRLIAPRLRVYPAAHPAPPGIMETALRPLFRCPDPGNRRSTMPTRQSARSASDSRARRRASGAHGPRLACRHEGDIGKLTTRPAPRHEAQRTAESRPQHGQPQRPASPAPPAGAGNVPAAVAAAPGGDHRYHEATAGHRSLAVVVLFAVPLKAPPFSAILHSTSHRHS